MTRTPTPFDVAALERAVPRYTSYPTAPQFGEAVDQITYVEWLEALPAKAALSLYVHVPFCDELCWFCACRTQGAKRYAPVARYLDRVLAEIARVAAHAGPDRPVARIHLGGGSPTVLAPEDLARLHAALVAAWPGAEGAEFAVEIDPRDMTPDRVETLGALGLGRASIGVQDFDPDVQAAIGRAQGYELTRDVIAALRATGCGSINIDLLYGLPGQSEASLADTVERVIGLGPDRLALFGYAHVPWMAKRQRMIREETLPGTAARRAQAALAHRILISAGYVAVGIDHFAKPEDALARAAADGTLRRNFQGYTVDPADALLGFGASAIGALPGGYVQNDPVTATYQLRIDNGDLAVKKGIRLSHEDAMRRDAIEQVLCSFALDFARIEARYGALARPLRRVVAQLLSAAPAGALEPWRDGFRIAEAWRSHARLIAAEFDAYLPGSAARHSLAV
ncbi:MAG: oxygen-independent coproporphyrinogen III oxidase [Paracoccaceae bacterium]